MYFGFDYPYIAREFDITIYNLDVLRILDRLFSMLRFELRETSTFLKKGVIQEIGTEKLLPKYTSELVIRGKIFYINLVTS